MDMGNRVEISIWVLACMVPNVYRTGDHSVVKAALVDTCFVSCVLYLAVSGINFIE